MVETPAKLQKNQGSWDSKYTETAWKRKVFKHLFAKRLPATNHVYLKTLKHRLCRIGLALVSGVLRFGARLDSVERVKPIDLRRAAYHPFLCLSRFKTASQNGINLLVAELEGFLLGSVVLLFLIFDHGARQFSS